MQSNKKIWHKMKHIVDNEDILIELIKTCGKYFCKWLSRPREEIIWWFYKICSQVFWKEITNKYCTCNKIFNNNIIFILVTQLDLSIVFQSDLKKKGYNVVTFWLTTSSR